MLRPNSSQLPQLDFGRRSAKRQLDTSSSRGPHGKLSKVDPEFPCFSHVDDLSHVLVGETGGELKAKLLKAGRLVGGEVKRLHLTLSDKSTLLPQNEITRAVALKLTEEGIPLETAKTCDDVGVQMSGSHIRKAKSLNIRIKVKGADRAKRTSPLVKTNRETMK